MVDSLGDRMKTYEGVTRAHLVRRTPVILRLDGKAFHTLTRKMNRPFDLGFMSVMQGTALAVCKEIQGAQVAYTQSDEISVLIVDYQKLDSEGWFDYNVQKMVSVAASVATVAFNKGLAQCYPGKVGYFDCRVFNVPREDVCNYFVWRQKDATRNSIQSVAQSLFSQRELTGLNCDQLQEKVWQEKQINWNNYAVPCKRGSCVKRIPDPNNGLKQKYMWFVDLCPPVFTQDRAYIEKHVNLDAPEPYLPIS